MNWTSESNFLFFYVIERVIMYRKLVFFTSIFLGGLSASLATDSDLDSIAQAYRTEIIEMFREKFEPKAQEIVSARDRLLAVAEKKNVVATKEVEEFLINLMFGARVGEDFSGYSVQFLLTQFKNKEYDKKVLDLMCCKVFDAINEYYPEVFKNKEVFKGLMSIERGVCCLLDSKFDQTLCKIFDILKDHWTVDQLKDVMYVIVSRYADFGYMDYDIDFCPEYLRPWIIDFKDHVGLEKFKEMVDTKNEKGVSMMYYALKLSSDGLIKLLQESGYTFDESTMYYEGISEMRLSHVVRKRWNNYKEGFRKILLEMNPSLWEVYSDGDKRVSSQKRISDILFEAASLKGEAKNKMIESLAKRVKQK